MVKLWKVLVTEAELEIALFALNFLLTEFCIVSYVLVDKENPNGVFLVLLLIKHMK